MVTRLEVRKGELTRHPPEGNVCGLETRLDGCRLGDALVVGRRLGGELLQLGTVDKTWVRCPKRRGTVAQGQITQLELLGFGGGPEAPKLARLRCLLQGRQELGHCVRTQGDG